MNYPLISEYIEAIKDAEDNFEKLTNLRAVLGEDGQPEMTSGNFAVVFKMKDEETGKLYALKCFTKEQQGREEAYHQIAEELKDVDSPYLVSLRYLEKELFVDTEQTDETEFPVLLMDWVEGKTLDKYLRENLDDKYALEMLAYRFSQLAQWLIPQPFAHGDLKPDNILVREDGSLVLVDYDGMYVPAMKGQKARELGSPDFRHPSRTENDFDEHIDDFPFVSLLLSLKAISLNPNLLEEYGAEGRLLFSVGDYNMLERGRAITERVVFNSIPTRYDIDYLYRSFLRQLVSPQEKVKQDNLLLEAPVPLRIRDTRFEGSRTIHAGEARYYGYKLVGYKDKEVYTQGGTFPEIYEYYQYQIKPGTITICDNAFKDCHCIRFLSIPNSVKYIGERAFSGCNIHYIELPVHLDYICENAFENCKQLKAIIIPPNNYLYTSDMLRSYEHLIVEIDKEYVISKISIFLRKEKNKGKSFWETINTFITSICSIYNVFGNLSCRFLRDGVRTGGTVHICSYQSQSDYSIRNIEDVTEVSNAIYYLLLEISGVDIIMRESYINGKHNYPIYHYRYPLWDYCISSDLF